ncbi:shugoshin 1 [Colius striatus]|uniref:shugoshin 1 n=1 Tax=Colius striatus TaxID=57412 RepID=UPI002B1CE4B2|nr:shugoshin 1 [Colius striatus]
MNPSSLKYTLSLPSGTTNQKLVEIDPLETSIDKTVSSKENQLCIEVICNSTFLPHDKTTQSLRQSGKLTKQYNNSSLPIHGNVTKRKKLAVLHKSEIQPNIKDFVKKCSSDNLPHYGIDSGISTNDMNLQESSSDLSHIIPLPLKFRNENKIDFKKLLFTDKRKPEETVYYADMDLTASHAGELLTVTVKGKDKLHQNKVSNANSDKILANFRKVKYSKKDKEKMKSMTEVNSNLYTEESHAWADSSKIAETTDLQTQLFQSLTEELPTRNSVEKQSLLDTSKNYETQNCPSKATDSERTSQVNLMSPRKETNTEAFSETFKDMESKTQKPDSNLPVNKMPPEVYRAENLPFQDNSSNVLPLQQDSLYTNEKPKINRKTFHNLSEMNTEKYCGGENEQYGEDASKKSQTEICDRDSKGIQDQNIIKRKYQKKSSYKQSRETESDSINKITPKADQRRSHFSSGRLKHTLAKASRKAYVVPTKNLAQFSLCKDKGLKNKDALHAEAVGVNKITETQQMPAALVTQNGISMNTLQDKEQDDGDDDNTLKKVESSSVAHKPHHISNSDNQEGLSNVEFAALDNHNAVMNFAILNNSEISEDQSKALGAGKAEQKLDVISEDSYKNTLIPCHGRKALQDLTNTGIQSHTFLPKSSKALEGSLAAQSRRKRATICYREPNLRSKLRRGDQFTETQFLDSPVYRVKNKNRFKSKQKII